MHNVVMSCIQGIKVETFPFDTSLYLQLNAHHNKVNNIMAKFAILVPALAALAPLASARNCTPGLVYCGRILYDIGQYPTHNVGSSLLEVVNRQRQKGKRKNKI